jgi:triphosphoribosyl-dephospho-CoA synthase
VHLRENLILKVKTVNDIVRCTTLSSLLEVAGWPKPGNVHRTHNFPTTRFEHFLAGIAAIQPDFRNLCERTFQKSRNLNENCSFIKLGRFFKDATRNMMAWQGGGNVLLGHILILGPLVAAAARCLKLKKKTIDYFTETINFIIDNTTVKDTIFLYEAIRLSTPGGMGKIEKYDVYDNNSQNAIYSDKITLKRIFELSQTYDTISLEYSTGFNLILNEGLPYFLSIYDETNDINIATVNTFLKILADYPDTLIIRKAGKKAAQLVSEKAYDILKNNGLKTKKGLKLTYELDSYLQEKGGNMNPGTSADLLSGIIFCALIFGLMI